MENIAKLNVVKQSIGKNGNAYYYQKMHFEDNWLKIPKLNYEYYLKDNLSIATEIEKDTVGNVIYLKFPHENSKQKKERLEVEKKANPKPEIDLSKNKISLIKKTLGKNGKYYFYESLSSVEKAEDVNWYRTDEAFYNYILKSYKGNSSKVEKDESGNIIYMEYESKSILAKINNDSETIKKNKGCLMILAFFLMLILIPFLV